MGFGQYSDRGHTNTRTGQRATDHEGKRAKAVHSDSMVAHLWANKAQDHARTANGNMYFEGDTIYSYGSHFPIARHVTQGKGKRARHAVLFTDRNYSVTTAKHKSIVRHALRGSTLVLHVPRPDVVGKSGSHGDALNPSEYFAAQVRDAKAALLNKRLVRQYDLNAFRSTCEHANAFAHFFGLRWKFNYDKVLSAADHASLQLKMEKTIAWDADKELRREEKRARDRVRWADKNAWPWLRIAWLSGEPVRLDYWHDAPQEERTLLRVRGDEIETSRGATFPKGDAVRAFRLIQAVRSRGETWRPGELANCKLGGFAIDMIQPNGRVRAGCHVVEWDAIEFAARQLGLVG